MKNCGVKKYESRKFVCTSHPQNTDNFLRESFKIQTFISFVHKKIFL